MKIYILSDTHGFDCAERFALLARDADLIIHLGDGYFDAQRISAEAGKSVISIKGNCDIMGTNLENIRIDNHIIMCTHGHLYGVKTGLTTLSYAADEAGADIVLYGHTHVPDITNYNNKWFINPGSLGRPHSSVRTYCVLTLKNGRVMPEFKEF